MKGQKTGGRQKGTPNKAGGGLKTQFDELLTGNFYKFQQELNQLSGKDFVMNYLKICEYVLPKLTRSQTAINFDDMTETEIEALLDLITQRLKNG